MLQSRLKLIVSLTIRMVTVTALFIVTIVAAPAATPARQLFAAKRLPTTQPVASYGFYSRGCLAGGIALANDGPTWQAMRPSRNLRWGHPNLIKQIKRLSIDAKRFGWNGLLVGDMSQPRGGPVKGHASHQVGLDADIWLRPMPNRRMSRLERQKTSSTWMLKKGSVYVDNRVWTKAHEKLLKTAASYRQVDRLFVHPGIKKKLCDTVTGDRSWLRKVRPYWGHQSHFHMRIKCPPGSPTCKKQAAPPAGIGCGKSLDWWFNVAFAPKKKTVKKKTTKKKKKKKARRYKTMADLPKICRVVLNGPAPTSLASVVAKPGGGVAVATAKAKAIAITATSEESPAAQATRTMAKKAKKAKKQRRVAVPQPRPGP